MNLFSIEHFDYIGNLKQSGLMQRAELLLIVPSHVITSTDILTYFSQTTLPTHQDVYQVTVKKISSVKYKQALLNVPYLTATLIDKRGERAIVNIYGKQLSVFKRLKIGEIVWIQGQAVLFNGQRILNCIELFTPDQIASSSYPYYTRSTKYNNHQVVYKIHEALKDLDSINVAISLICDSTHQSKDQLNELAIENGFTGVNGWLVAFHQPETQLQWRSALTVKTILESRIPSQKQHSLFIEL